MLMFLTGFAQEILVEQNAYLESYFSDRRAVYPLVDKASGKVTLFLLDCDSIRIQQYDKDFRFQKNYHCARPKGKFKHLTGHTISNNKYHLYFSNKKRKEFLVQTIDIKSKENSEKRIPLKISKEQYLESVCCNNKLYVLSRKLVSSIYKLRVFKGTDLENCVEYDLSEKLGKRVPQDVISDDIYGTPIEKKITNFVKIENADPNPLDLTSKENKLYCVNNQLILSFDDFADETLVIKIDLNNYALFANTYEQGKFTIGKNLKTRSNSYVYNNSLYQLRVSRSEICFLVRDLDSGQLLKEFKANRDEKINFSNTPLMLKGTAAFRTNDRELETKQLLRKLAANRVGVSAYQRNGQLQVKIGGVKEEDPNVVGFAVMFGVIGAITYTALAGSGDSNNTTMASFLNYHNNKAMVFTSLFDPENLQHITGEPSANPYDEMKEFISNEVSSLSAFTLFKLNDYYVLGYYMNESDKYVLRKFE